jgi:hypothetical protein
VIGSSLTAYRHGKGEELWKEYMDEGKNEGRSDEEMAKSFALKTVPLTPDVALEGKEE